MIVLEYRSFLLTYREDVVVVARDDIACGGEGRNTNEETGLGGNIRFKVVVVRTMATMMKVDDL